VRIRASVQEIGNQLKRQADLIPNLEKSAKAYLKHEREIFEKLTEVRRLINQAQKTGNIEDAGKASELIAGFIPNLRIVVESNPEIKGVEILRQLMDELRDTADKVMYSRRSLIDLTADYNSMRVSFPSNIVAAIFGFQEEKGFETPSVGDHIRVSEEEVKTPKLNL
jgi:LemA protein